MIMKMKRGGRTSGGIIFGYKDEFEEMHKKLAEIDEKLEKVKKGVEELRL